MSTTPSRSDLEGGQRERVQDCWVMSDALYKFDYSKYDDPLELTEVARPAKETTHVPTGISEQC